MNQESFDLGYMEGFEDAIDYIKQRPDKFGLTKAEG